MLSYPSELPQNTSSPKLHKQKPQAVSRTMQHGAADNPVTPSSSAPTAIDNGPPCPHHRPHNDGSNSSHEADATSATADPPPFYRAFNGALVFNLASLVLPALYSTLSKLWVARIDASLVATTDVHTYLSVMLEVLNEGLPRASWVIIGDTASRTLPHRLALTHTLILVQSLLGLTMSVVFVAAAPALAASFVPGHVRPVTVDYIRITAFTALTGAIETAVALATRALDRPDVPLIISSVKFAANIVLDLALISPLRVGRREPTVLRQAAVLLACNAAAALVGIAYFFWRTTLVTRKKRCGDQGTTTDIHGESSSSSSCCCCSSSSSTRPSLSALLVLARPGLITLAESAIRNVLYLWLVTNIVAMGTTYVTAWGVFNTIRWGLIMVPVQALEQTSLTFTGHAWGGFRRSIGASTRRWSSLAASASASAEYSNDDVAAARAATLRPILRPAATAAVQALVIELPMCLFMSLYGVRPFAKFLSGSDSVADVAAIMWRTLDWCYIFYALSTQMATVLLATRPRWYLWQSLVSNMLYVLPWAVACQTANLDATRAWKYHSLVFGGSLVFSFVDIAAFVCFWYWTLMKGRMTLDVFRRF